MVKGPISLLEFGPFFAEKIFINNTNEFSKIYLHNYLFVLKFITVNIY